MSSARTFANAVAPPVTATRAQPATRTAVRRSPPRSALPAARPGSLDGLFRDTSTRVVRGAPPPPHDVVARRPTRSAGLSVGAVDDPAEREADRVAAADVSGSAVPAVRRTGDFGARRSTVIRRVPAAFAGERARLEANPRTKPNAFTSFFGWDPWGKVVDAVGAYAGLYEEAVPNRQAAMRALATTVTTWTSDHLGKVKAGDNDAADDARHAEVVPTGALGAKIRAERLELAQVSGTLAVPRGVPVLAEPGATTRQGAKGTLNQDVVLAFDAKLTKSSGLTVGSGTACSIFADYPADGSMLVSVVSPQQGKITAWVPRDAMTVTDAPRVDPAGPTGPLPTSVNPPPEVEHFHTGMMYRDLLGAPLFPHPPTVDDVRQGGLGDCYLHAALLSIVARNPSDIVAMMRDDGATVTVRLFEVTRGATTTFAPKYARVQKSEVMTVFLRRQRGKDVGNVLGGEAYAMGAVWVKMIEKAYAAAGMSGLGAALVGPPSFGEIASGFTARAMESLLGQEADVSFEALQTGVGVNPALLPEGVARLPWSAAERDAHAQAKVATDGKEQAYAGLVSHSILGDVAAVDAWMDFVAKVDIEAAIRTRLSKGTDYRKGEIRLDDFAEQFRESGLEERLAQPVLAWLAAKRLYPGKRGTGKYTANQLALFARIRTLLKSGGYAGVATKAEVGRVVGGTGHSGGESKTKGIAGGHAYAVLGFSPDKDPSQLLPGELAMVRLRNPWGNYGRQYEDRVGDKLKVKKAAPTGDSAADIAATEAIHRGTPGGEFMIELSDLTKRFAWLDSTGPRG